MKIEIGGQEYSNEDVPLALAKEALQVQDACNLSGIVFSLAKHMQTLCDHPRCTGTSWRNHHPIVVLFLSKLDSLCTGDLSDGVGSFSKAYDLINDVVNQG